MSERPFSYKALFAVVYTTSVSSMYFALGVVAHRANGLTPAVFLVAGLFFGLTPRAPRCTPNAAGRPCSPATRSTS